MAITRMKTSGYLTGTKSDSFLAGNPTYDPATFEPIAYATGTGSSPTITFSSIPQTYVSLQLRMIVRESSGPSTGTGTINMYLNGVTGSSNYAAHYLQGNGSAASAGATSSDSEIWLWGASMRAGSTASAYAATIVDIHDYASTSRNKTIRFFSGGDGNAADTNYKVNLGSGLYYGTTNAVTSISLTTASGYNFDTNTQVVLYGLRGA